LVDGGSAGSKVASLFNSTIGLALPSLSAAALSSRSITDINPSTGSVIRVLSLDPPYIPGWLGPYKMKVRHDVTVLRIHLAFDWDNANSTQLSAPITCTINAAPVRMSADLDAAACSHQLSAAAALSDSCASLVPLAIGSNQLLCSTPDGTYDINIRRGSSAFDVGSNLAMKLPSSMYANQVIDDLTVQARGDELMHADADLTLTIASSTGEVMPNVWTYVDGSSEVGMTVASSTASFSFHAPSIVAEATPLYLVLLPTGPSAWSLPHPSILTTLILPQASVTVTDLPVYGSWFSLEDADPITVTLSQRVNRGRELIVTVEMVEVESGAVLQKMAELRFIYDDELNQPVPVHAPLTTSPLPVSIRLTLSGDDAVHYSVMSSPTITILSRSTFQLSGRPDELYVSKAAVMTYQPTTAPNETVTVTVTLDGGGGLTVGDVKELAENEAITGGSAVLPGLTTIALIYPAYSMAPVAFTYIAPLHLTSATSTPIHLHFHAQGDDARFLPLPSHTITILPHVPVTFYQVPNNIMNRDSVSLMATAPIGTVDGLTMTLHCDHPRARFDPSSLTVEASSAAHVIFSFTFHAPYWYDENVESLNVWMELSGADSAMFTAPPIASIPFQRQPAVVSGVDLYAMASDGQSMLLSSSLAPFIGNKMTYAYDLAVAVMDPDFQPIEMQGQQAQSRANHLTLAHDATRLFSAFSTLASTDASSGNETSPDPSTNALNVSIAFQPYFSSGTLSLIVTRSANATDPTHQHLVIVTYTLDSSSRSPWILLEPGVTTLTLVSSHDGNYTSSTHLCHSAQCW